MEKLIYSFTSAQQKSRLAFLLSLSLLYLSTFTYGQVIEPVQIASGFTDPVDIVHAGDERLFIVEQDGLIKIIDVDGSVLPTPFLDVRSLVSTGGERGLLGLAFHPNYADNGYFFVNYTNTSQDTRVVRYQRSSDNPNLADPTSALQLIAVDQPAGNHNGGCLRFGPDGYLYIGLGDGGSGGDPWNNSQTPTTLLGKMLRIDVDTEGAPYGIPADNPFVDDTGILDEIWALGLRNPWRFSFDSETGDLWIGDVGQDAFEEIDFQPADSEGGENYGWRCYEGDAAFNLGASCTGDYTFPVHTLANNSGSPYCSVTGGVVYRGSEFPALYGKYIYGDFCDNDLLSIEPDGSGGWTASDLGSFPFTYSTFGEDVYGEVYFANYYGGQIYKLTVNECIDFSATAQVTNNVCEGETDGSATIDISGGTPPYIFDPETVLDELPAGTYNLSIMDANDCSTEVSFTILAFELPEPVIEQSGDTLSVASGFATYQWLLDGEPIVGENEAVFVPAQSGAYSVLVTNDNDCAGTSDEVDFVVSVREQIPYLNKVQLTPNPFADQLQLQLQVDGNAQFGMSLLSAKGAVILQETIQVTGEYSQTLNLSSLPAGVYYIRLQSAEGGQVERRIVKQ